MRPGSAPALVNGVWLTEAVPAVFLARMYRPKEGFVFHVLTFAALLGTGTGDLRVDARVHHHYNHLRMPAHGTVHKGMLYGFFDDDWARTDKDGNPGGGARGVDAVPLGKVAKINWKNAPRFFSTPFGGNNFRHHVRYGALWFSTDNSFLSRWYFEDIQKIEADYLRDGPPTGDAVVTGIFLLKLMEKSNKITKTQVAFDSVPISKFNCKTFMLMKKEKKFEAWDTQEVDWDAETKQYKSLAAVQNLETFDSSFLDDFYAVIRKNDYYFVTESGELYHAPPPKEGEKSRTMKALWTDAKRPIVAVIEDADRDKVWLFAKQKVKTDGGKDVFFEMKDTIRPEPFDASKLRPVNIEGRAKMLLEYLPLIQGDAK